MRKRVAVLLAVLALGLFAAPGRALAGTGIETDLPEDLGSLIAWPPVLDEWIVWPPWFDPWILDRLGPLIEAIAPPDTVPPPSVTPPSMPFPTCDTLALAAKAAYADCDVQATEVSDPRTGRSFTTTVSVDVCRREASGDECVTTGQSLGRTGAEAGPTVRQDRDSITVPQACVGSACTPAGSISAPSKVTVFDAGTTPEVTVYTPTGAVNANAPSACVSLDNTCTASTTTTGTGSAAVENVNATQVLSTN